MTILDDLYYGNIHPCDRNVVRGSPTDKLLDYKLMIYICKGTDTKS